MKLGLTQYAARADGRGFVEAAAKFNVAGVEPFIGDAGCEFLNWQSDDVEKFVSHASRLNVRVPSVAVGLFNGDASLVSEDGREKAIALIRRSLQFSAGVGAAVMLLCGYFASHPNTPQKKANLLAVVKAVEPITAEYGIKLALELPLPAKELLELVKTANSGQVGVYYDVGNAVALGFDPSDEINILQRHILAIHVKDSDKQIGSLHLGQGRLNLDSAMSAIKSIGYEGWIMVETLGDNEAETRVDLEKVRALM